MGLHIVIVHMPLDVHVWSIRAIVLFIVTSLTKSESTWQQLTGITTFTFPLLPNIQVNRCSVESITSVCTHNSEKIVKADKGYHSSLPKCFTPGRRMLILLHGMYHSTKVIGICWHQLLLPSHHFPQQS